MTEKQDIERLEQQVVALAKSLETLKRELTARDDFLYKIKSYMGDDNFRQMAGLLPTHQKMFGR